MSCEEFVVLKWLIIGFWSCASNETGLISQFQILDMLAGADFIVTGREKSMGYKTLFTYKHHGPFADR
jgi:hypothetical protein